MGLFVGPLAFCLNQGTLVFSDGLFLRFACQCIPGGDVRCGAHFVPLVNSAMIEDVTLLVMLAVDFLLRREIQCEEVGGCS